MKLPKTLPESVTIIMLIPKQIRTKVGDERISLASLQNERNKDSSPKKSMSWIKVRATIPRQPALKTAISISQLAKKLAVNKSTHMAVNRYSHRPYPQQNSVHHLFPVERQFYCRFHLLSFHCHFRRFAFLHHSCLFLPLNGAGDWVEKQGFIARATGPHW